MAQLLFCIIFSAMLHNAFRKYNSGAMIRDRSNGGLLNPQRLKARTKVSLLLLRELLFADDCALIARNEDELRSILNDFARVALRYGLTISITKTEVMPQPKLGSSPPDLVINIGGKQLKVVKTFCYLEGFLSQNGCIDDEITPELVKEVPALDGCTTDCGQIMVLASAQILVYIKQLC